MGLTRCCKGCFPWGPWSHQRSPGKQPLAQGLNPDSGCESPVLFSVWRLDGVGRYRPAPPPRLGAVALGWGCAAGVSLLWCCLLLRFPC